MSELTKSLLIPSNNLPKISLKKIGSSLNFSVCEEKQQLITEVKMSDKSKQAFKIADKLDEQMKENRSYLTQFGNKVEQIYEKEVYRKYLNEKWYENIIKELESKKEGMVHEVERMKDDKRKDLKGSMEENEELEKLKKNYERILEREEKLLNRESEEYKIVKINNEETKNMIKTYWKQAEILKYKPEEQVIILKSKHNYTKSTQISQLNHKLSTQTESIYITEKDSNTDREQLSKHSIVCLDKLKKGEKVRNGRKFSQISIDNQSIKSQHLNSSKNSKDINSFVSKNGSESLNSYENAIRRIEELEVSISRSKVPKKKSLEKASSVEEESRKERLKEKIESAHYKKDILKLFLSYLKSKEALSRNTGIENIHKVIFYLERALESKEEILKQVENVMNCLKS